MAQFLRFWAEDPIGGGDRIAKQFWGDIFAKLLHGAIGRLDRADCDRIGSASGSVAAEDCFVIGHGPELPMDRSGVGAGAGFQLGRTALKSKSAFIAGEEIA